jgi:serine/threonine protein phosphatase PrpC
VSRGGNNLTETTQRPTTDNAAASSNKTNMAVSIAEDMNPTRRNNMEDVHAFHPPGTWNAPDSNATFIGVYDGHGGRGIVDYLEDNFSRNVAKEWWFGESNGVAENQNVQNKKRRLCDNANSDDAKHNESKAAGDDDGQTIRKALERAFLLTDIQSRMAGIQTSGATVACCIVLPKFNADNSLESISVHCANAGDARIVLSSSVARLPESDSGCEGSADKGAKSKAQRLTHDHKATDPEEISRIQSSGGMMLRGRVLGVLAVARSLGDHGLKEFVIGRPHLSSTVVEIQSTESSAKAGSNVVKMIAPLTDGEFLIVACDGLWDVVEDQEAVDLVRNFVSDETSIHSLKSRQDKAARYLIDEALRRGSTDNITVIVYWL